MRTETKLITVAHEDGDDGSNDGAGHRVLVLLPPIPILPRLLLSHGLILFFTCLNYKLVSLIRSLKLTGRCSLPLIGRQTLLRECQWPGTSRVLTHYCSC